MGEFVLGAKRPPRSRRIVRRVAVAAALAGIVLFIAYIALMRATRYPVPSGSASEGPFALDGNRLTWARSSLERQGDLWILRLTGDPYELGFDAARLFGVAASDADGIVDASILGEETPSGISGAIHDTGLRWRFRLLADGIPAPRQAEIAGLAAGLRRDGVAGMDYQRLVWRQAAIDVGEPPGAVVPGGVSSGLAFALGGAAAGRIIIGRAFGFPGATPPGPPVVSIVRTTGAIAFARVGWAGEIGAVTGVNAEGLAVIVDPAMTQDVRADATGEPVTLLARDLLEKAHTIDEAVALVQATRPLGAASFLIVDGKTQTWAVIERSPAKTVVARGKSPAVIGDYLAASDFTKDADNDRARRTRRGSARIARLAEILARPNPPEPLVVAGILRDRRARGDTPLPLGNGNAIDDLEQAHVVILDPMGMLLWVGEGPGAAGPLHVFDLRHELGGEPLRVPAPLAIPADAGVDLNAARATGLARRELREGSRLARAGERSRAEDAVARGLALAPDLPDLHRLAGDLARDAGEDARAADSYRRFLELSPADLSIEQEVRAYLGGP